MRGISPSLLCPLSAKSRTASAGSLGGDDIVACRAMRVSLPCPRPTLPSPAFAGEGKAGKQERRGTAWSGVGALLHLPEHIVEVEGGSLLALRILPERLQELPDKGLRRYQQ